LEFLKGLAGALPWAEMGWPVVVAAIVAFVAAFSTRHTWAGFAGASIGAPLCLYLSDMPYLHWVSLAALPASFVAAAAVWRGRRDIAFAMLLPFMMMVVLAVILLIRNFSVFEGYRF
jgi:hypothetical protein